MQDPILDWLDLYGKARGFVRDDQLPGYSQDTDMGLFLREKGSRFEEEVLRCLREKFKIVSIADADARRSFYEAQERSDERGTQTGIALDERLYQRTLEAMREGAEIIYQPVVQDRARGTYGIPDLLVRSDQFERLVEHAPIAGEEVRIPSGLADSPFHYRVVDIKFTNLELTAKAMVGNNESDRRRKVQLLLYNRALGEMQGYEPPTAYLIGRSFSFTAKGTKYRGDGCFDRLGPAEMTDPSLGETLDAAVDWRRRLLAEGMNWDVFPSPSVPELFPNMKNTQDAPWHMAKKEIGEKIGELTQLWYITPQTRPLAHEAGVITFSDERLETLDLGLKDKKLETLRQIIRINRDACADKVRPTRVGVCADVWRTPNPVEFFVDFETVSGLDDDFTKMPNKGGQNLIYMIGCGHVEAGEWQFTVFTCDRLTLGCERQIIDAWMAHMMAVQERLWPSGKPLVFHWSHAETSSLNTSFDSARKRHQADWPELQWFDFLVRVMREEPVVIKGSLAFGLKSVAKALHRQGAIRTNWTNGPGDGLGAMVGAWRCNERAIQEGKRLPEIPLMQSIQDYNEVDCRVMQEIVDYLRQHH
jgi:hypothetical protein